MLYILSFSTFQRVLAHASHHVIPHDDGHVRPRVLDGLGHLGHMTQEKVLHGASGRSQPHRGLLALAEHVHLETVETRASAMKTQLTNQRAHPYLVCSDVQCVQIGVQLHHLPQHLHHQLHAVLFVGIQGADALRHLSQVPHGPML